MPIYAYRCESCGFEKDVLQKLSDAPLTKCTHCGAETFRKQVTAAGFQLKGSGWYVTDFRGGNSGNGNGTGAAATGAKAAGESAAASEGGKPSGESAAAPAGSGTSASASVGSGTSTNTSATASTAGTT
ncbi:FmdB family zinc ribbon protein [Paraburkholderia denitrificans]|uniref:FmdB family zinc ribbon protein n=1 Tax=Paraburkholderia denitrificans TaxID=694025 RepID=A0ABW0JD07_9BURK